MAATMRALVKAAAAPGLELQERPVPEPDGDEVLIRVLRTGICGTDLHIHQWDAWAAATVPPGLVIGHEFVGRVEAVGERVKAVREGEIVSGEGHIVCGQCRHCRAGRRHLCIDVTAVGVTRDGCFADYLVLPAGNVWVHEDAISRDLQANIRIDWIHTPGSDLFLVFNTSYHLAEGNDDLFDPRRDVIMNDRVGVAKLTYLIML